MKLGRLSRKIITNRRIYDNQTVQLTAILNTLAILLKEAKKKHYINIKILAGTRIKISSEPEKRVCRERRKGKKCPSPETSITIVLPSPGPNQIQWFAFLSILYPISCLGRRHDRKLLYFLSVLNSILNIVKQVKI